MNYKNFLEGENKKYFMIVRAYLKTFAVYFGV